MKRFKRVLNERHGALTGGGTGDDIPNNLNMQDYANPVCYSRTKFFCRYNLR